MIIFQVSKEMFQYFPSHKPLIIMGFLVSPEPQNPFDNKTANNQTLTFSHGRRQAVSHQESPKSVRHQHSQGHFHDGSWDCFTTFLSTISPDTHPNQILDSLTFS